MGGWFFCLPSETKPKEPGLGKPCAGKPLARFDEGEGSERGLPTRCSLYSTSNAFSRITDLSALTLQVNQCRAAFIL
jgi:hypothetical protein